MKKLYCAILFLILTATSKAQTYAWTKTFGGNDVDNGYTVATDLFGNVFLGGSYAYDSIDADPSSAVFFLPANAGDNTFFAKYDASGNLIWAHTIGNDNNDIVLSMATDSYGSLYIVGTFYDSMDFDPSAAVSSISLTSMTIGAYIAKYDADGNYLWSHAIDGNGYDIALKVATDSSDNVYVTGSFEDTVDFDPTSGVDNHVSTYNRDIYLVKYSSSGSFIWARSVAGAGDDLSRELAVSDSGYVYIGGAIGGTADFDPSSSVGTVTAFGGVDIFFAKYDSLGNYIWAKIIGSSFSAEDCFGLAVDLTGNVYISGGFYKPLDFDPSSGTATLTPTGSGSVTDIYFAKYTPNGNYIMAKNVGGTGNDYPYDLKIDPLGYFYLTGYFKNTVDFDPGTGIINATATGTTEDIFLAKYDLSGNFQWVKNTGGTGDDMGRCISLSHTGDVYFTGWFNNSFDFNPGSGIDNRASNGGQDFFLTKYSNPTTSIQSDQTTDFSSIKIYPNPANNTLFCETSQNTQIYIYNSSGALVLSQQFNAGKHSLDISPFVPGIYLVCTGNQQNGTVIIKQ